MSSGSLQQPAFIRFLSSMALSSLAYQMLVVAVGWQVYDLTHSAMSLGLIGLMQFTPQFLLTLVVGHVADRYDRRLIVMMTRLLQGVLVGILAFGSWQGWIAIHGIFACAFLLGAVVMSLLLARYAIRNHAGKIMFAAVATFGVATIIFGLSESFLLSFAALLVLGASDMVSVVIRSSLIQLETPDEMRGRVSAVNFIFIGASNQLGEFESGVTAAWWGVVPAVVVGGIGTLLIVALWMKYFPALVQRQQLTKAVS